VVNGGTGTTTPALVAGTNVSITGSWPNQTINSTAAGGDVVGPASATDNALVRFDSTTGKLIQNSVAILDDSGNLTGIANLTVNGNNISAVNSLGFRNRIINGDMGIDQRNAGASVTLTADLYTVDRFLAGTASATNSTAQRSTTAPSGFNNSLLVTIGTGASPASSASNAIRQEIEGFNVADLGWGTASAKTVTISFWVRSSLTGTFGGALSNAGINRAYPYTYSISAANTWEYKTVIIPGDISGTWATDNSSGIRFWIDLGSGTDKQGTAGSWGAADYRAASGCVQLVATSGATFFITGVQLEAGSVATPFERRDYGRELIMCQRYYYSNGAAFYGNVSFHQFSNGSVTTTSNAGSIQLFPVTMRTAPTFSATNPTNFRIGAAAGFFAVTAVALDVATSACANVNYTSSGMTAGQACGIVQNGGNLAALNFSAEL
jgi:hypothetical protein